MSADKQRQIRVGMVGGGPGAGIAETHRTAMRLDDRYALVAGVFSRDREKSLTAAQRLRIPEDRVYADYSAMAMAESERADGIEAVSIVTRTDSHYQIAKRFLEAGIHVICDKPLRFSNGARGTLWASMAAVGNEHGLRIRVYGERASLAWHHEDPHHLRYCPIDGSPQILAQGAGWLSPDANRWTRVGLGHPEGFFEAFANLYTEVADALLAKAAGQPYLKPELGFPDASDGFRGVAFVEGAMRSYAAGGVWTTIEAS
jgi:predicted dehydrogenase